MRDLLIECLACLLSCPFIMLVCGLCYLVERLRDRVRDWWWVRTTDEGDAK